MNPRISICIATYRRPQRLQLVLEDLLAQTLPAQQITVVDNDAQGSAREVAEAFARANPQLPLAYEIQPARNIALTRNRTVALADGDWLAFIDDDERAPAGWLELLMSEAQRLGADGLLGPVVPQVPDSAPAWIRAGRFYDFPRMSTGTEVPDNQLRFGNIILRGSLVRAEPGPFDVRYALMTGEDADLLLRLRARGARILWCNEALVHEPVEANRLSFRWLLKRSYSGGQEFARKTLAGRYGPIGPLGRIRFFAECAIKLVAGSVLSPLSLLVAPFLGRGRAAVWSIRAAANLGKLTAFAGLTYQEYSSASSSK
jgi:succinoglycan biosynthesis protein ExoM